MSESDVERDEAQVPRESEDEYVGRHSADEAGEPDEDGAEARSRPPAEGRTDVGEDEG